MLERLKKSNELLELILKVQLLSVDVDCITVGFFLKISKKKKVKRGLRVLRARSARRACEAREKRIFSFSPPVSLTVYSLVPDLLFDCSRVLKYAKIRTVLQSTVVFVVFVGTFIFCFVPKNFVNSFTGTE